MYLQILIIYFKYNYWFRYHNFRIKDHILFIYERITQHHLKFFVIVNTEKGNILNSKCIEGSGRSRLGGKRVVGCDN